MNTYGISSINARLLLSALFCSTTLLAAQAGELDTNLQKGLFEEEANHNLAAAIDAYQAVVTQFDKNHQLAATAVFRLGECYRKQGNTNASVQLYQRVLREFSDQPQLTSLSRQQLISLGRSDSASATALSDAGRQEQKRLFAEEIRLLEQRLVVLQKQVTNGILPESELLPTQREILDLKRQAAALDAAPPRAYTPGGPVGADAAELERIHDLIANSPDLLNALDKNDETLLEKASAKGELSVVNLLLDSGAAVDGLKRPALTPLHYAAGNGHKAVVDLLLSKGARLDARTESGVTPLHLAARNGYAVIAQTLLDAGAPLDAAIVQIVSRDTEDLRYSFGPGQTPLHAAAESSQPQVVDLLLAKGANVNAIDAQGRTPLSYAVSGGNLAVIKALLNAKADPNAGHRALPLGLAVTAGELDLVRLLLSQGADPNHPTTQESTLSPEGFVRLPLSLALLGRKPAVITELIKAKADPNAIDQKDEPILFEALTQGVPGVDSPSLKALLDGGADPNARTSAGDPAIYRAVAVGNLDATRLLLDHRADPNARDSRGHSALLAAVLTGRKDMIDLLIAKGADVNLADNQDQTPLALALARTPSAPRPGTASPYLPGPPIQAATATGSRARSSEIADLLRAHGALSEVPDLSSIRVTCATWPAPRTFLTRDKQGLNHFTLLELLAEVYGPEHHQASDQPSVLPFPDLAQIKIHRPAHGQTGQASDHTVNLFAQDQSFDISKDQELEFGDVVEIPEREHSLSEPKTGLTTGQWDELKQHLARKVSLVVKGQSTQFPLNGLNASTYLSQALQMAGMQAVLRSSSDFSQVHIKRRGWRAGEVQELTENVLPFWNDRSPLSDDLWLRDGDVIEVPDKP